jgi:hypothetical protein
VCPGEYVVTANGTIRHHLTDNPDFQAGPDSRKCRGAGEKPAGAAEEQSGDGPQCRLCKHPVQLTDNGRARSHLTPEQTPRSCPGGSDSPLGQYPDMVGTTDGLVATLRADCEHVPVGQCYACYAADGAKSCPDHGDPIECTCQAKAGQAQMAAEKQSMADQLKATPTDDFGQPLRECFNCDRVGCAGCGALTTDDSRPEASRFVELLAQETRAAGTVLDRIDPAVMRAPEPQTCEPVTHDVREPVGPDPELPNCPHPETHRAGCGCPNDDSARREPIDGWRTPLDLMEKMSGVVQGLDALRLNCGECGHPVTPLVDHFGPDGRAARVVWACENYLHPDNPCRGHECEPNTRVMLGHLDEGDHFTRRGTLMRVTGETNGVVHAVVVDGPHKGRTGDLPNLGELVDREPCRHSYLTEVPPSGLGFAGPGCEYCGHIPLGQETKECTDSKVTQTSQLSSAASTTRTTAPAPGSRPPTRASALAVSPKSESVTSSAPTATAAGNGRSAAVTTDQASAAAAFLGSGRPSAPVTTGPANLADAAAQFLAGGSGAHGEKETKRDRFGRYLIPHPDTGKETAWTRATTFAKSISDTYALSQWGLRMALLGATQRPDIVQRAHGKHVKADKSLLDELTAELKNAAGDKVAANLGTAMHSFTEMADRAWHSPGGARSILDQAPPDCREMVETYIRLLEETGLEPVPHLIEFTTVVKQYSVAGTSDNCYKVTKPLVLRIGRGEVRLSPGEYVIGDKKTGKDLDYGWQEIAIQLATYAQGLNTAGVWDRHEEEWHPKPLGDATVRLDAGIVLHLPVDKEAEKQPAVYGVDLESGWNAAVLCERVRAWRKVRKLASPVMVSEAETFAPARPEPAITSRTTVRPPSLMDKARTVTSRGEASAVWQEAKTAGLPDAKVDELVAGMQSRLKELAEPGG